MKNDQNILEIDDLHTFFYTEQGVVKAVNGVSYDVPKNAVVGVVGESGCGKSVTSMSVMRLIQGPTGQIVDGSIRFKSKEYKLDSKGVPDDDDQGKWVELYNRSDQSVSLAGYSLSDNEKKPTKWVFPEGTSIAGKGYLILYMSGSLPLEG